MYSRMGVKRMSERRQDRIDMQCLGVDFPHAKVACAEVGSQVLMCRMLGSKTDALWCGNGEALYSSKSKN